jgi:hypothetical protein
MVVDNLWSGGGVYIYRSLLTGSIRARLMVKCTGADTMPTRQCSLVLPNCLTSGKINSRLCVCVCVFIFGYCNSRKCCFPTLTTYASFHVLVQRR